jgi:hypothetical protein
VDGLLAVVGARPYLNRPVIALRDSIDNHNLARGENQTWLDGFWGAGISLTETGLFVAVRYDQIIQLIVAWQYVF